MHRRQRRQATRFHPSHKPCGVCSEIWAMTWSAGLKFKLETAHAYCNLFYYWNWCTVNRSICQEEISISNKIYSKLRQNLLFTSVPLGRDTTKAFVGHNLSILKQLIDVGNQIRDMIPVRLSVLVQLIREFAGRNLRYPAHAVVAYLPILVLTIIVRGSKFNYMLQHLWTEATS